MLGNCHCGELLECLEDVEVLFHVFLNHFAVFILILEETVCDLVEVITKSVVGSHDEFCIRKLV